MKERKVTIKDVAQRANVSKATVSYVLNGVEKVSDATKRRVLEVIEELGYKPNGTARDLAKRMNNERQEDQGLFFEGQPFYKDFMDSFVQMKVGKVPKETKDKLVGAIMDKGYLPSGFLEQLAAKKTIAVFLEMERDFKHILLEMNPVYQQLINSVEHTAKDHQLFVQILNSNDVHSYDVSMMEQSYLGVIVVGKIPTHLSVVLKQVEIPVVIIDEYEFDPNFVTVTSEDRKGAFDSVEYLILKGHKSIAFVGCKNDRGNFIEYRIAGYKDALESYGFTYKEQDVHLSEVNYSYEEGMRIAQKIAAGPYRYDAVFCTSDIMAIGLMKGLMKAGMKVPEDISIIGFDNIQFSKYSNPELTTVDQNIFLKGEMAVMIIMRKAKGEPVKNQYLLPVSIVERESVSKRN
ncbi:MAG: LacI family DNA-binding transcriptional regulator [Bacillus sp. (in: firmicutes)]